MKTSRLLTLTVSLLLSTFFVAAQTADEIINKYFEAIGGKELIGQVSTLYTEGMADAMGNAGTVKTTLVNGKAFKQEFDIAGTNVVMCYTDSMGWQLNPMTGGYSAEVMSDLQFNAGKDQIFVGGALAKDYKSLGYQANLLEQEEVMGVKAHKLEVKSPEGATAIYYFDPETGYLLRIVQKDMMGQYTDITLTFSDYQKPENGYLMPFATELNYAGQFFVNIKLNKVEVNKEIDPAIFAKP